MPNVARKQVNSKKEDKENNFQKERCHKKYQQALQYAKEGMAARDKGDLGQCIAYFRTFLGLMAEVYEVADLNDITPNLIDTEKGYQEVHLFSIVFFTLAKSVDRIQGKVGFQKYLTKFVEFTLNFPHQASNADMIRVFLSNRRAVYHREEFDHAYQRIFVSTTKCYIASHCYGENSVITNDLRLFKKSLLKMPFGFFFVKNYYRYSPAVVDLCKSNRSFDMLFTKVFARPFLFIFVKIARYWIS